MADAGRPLDALVNRVDRLERQNRRLKQGAVALVVMGVAAAAAAQTTFPRTTTVERLVLADDTSQMRAVLENLATPSGAGGSNNPTLTFFDRDGRAVVRLGVNDRGPMLEVMDRDGRMRNYFGPPTPRPATER
jgi:hypothetical protein